MVRMRSPSGWHQSGMRGREPVEIRAASNSMSLERRRRRRPARCCGPVKRRRAHDDAHALALEQVADVALQVALDAVDARR